MASDNPSSGNPFDPCRQWLGISALELDDPRKLLGLESVDDPIRILQAAEARIARLQGVEAGPYEVARRALVARIEEARDRLLAAAAANGWVAPTPPPPDGLTMPPSPTAATDDQGEPPPPFPEATHPFPHPAYPYPYPSAPYPSAPAPAPYANPSFGQPPFGQAYPPAPPLPPGQAGYPAPAGYPSYPQGAVTSQPGYPPAYGGYPQGMPTGEPYPPYPTPGMTPTSPAPFRDVDDLRGSGRIYRKSSSSEPFLLLVGALFTAIVALGLFAMNSSPPKTVASKPAVEKPAARKSPASSRRLSPGGHPLAGRDRLLPLPEEDEPAMPPQAVDDEAPQDPPPSLPPRPEQPPTTMTKPAQPPEPPMTEPEPPPEPPMPEPEPQPQAPDEPDPLARIDEAVKQCLEALVRREYDTAERSMNAVDGIAPQKREADRISGWRQLVSYAKGFYEYRDQAINAMKPGNEFDVKSKKIAVVEVTEGAITVKVAGQLKTWQRDDIPGAVLQAVVESWFDADPTNQLYLGAYHFTKAEPDLEQAEACWSKAEAGGADASLLIPLLSDPVVVDAGEP